jgi:hypothetical protein
MQRKTWITRDNIHKKLSNTEKKWNSEMKYPISKFNILGPSGKKDQRT